MDSRLANSLSIISNGKNNLKNDKNFRNHRTNCDCHSIVCACMCVCVSRCVWVTEDGVSNLCWKQRTHKPTQKNNTHTGLA